MINPTTRFCVDYCQFNDINKKASYSLPGIDYRLDTLAENATSKQKKDSFYHQIFDHHLKDLWKIRHSLTEEHLIYN